MIKQNPTPTSSKPLKSSGIPIRSLLKNTAKVLEEEK